MIVVQRLYPAFLTSVRREAVRGCGDARRAPDSGAQAYLQYVEHPIQAQRSRFAASRRRSRRLVRNAGYVVLVVLSLLPVACATGGKGRPSADGPPPSPPATAATPTADEVGEGGAPPSAVAPSAPPTTITVAPPSVTAPVDSPAAAAAPPAAPPTASPPDLVPLVKLLWPETPDEPKVVAVVGISEGPDKRHGPLCEMVEEALERAILQTHVGKPLDRRGRDKIRTLLHESLDPSVDPKLALSLAKKATANEVVYGQLYRKGRGIDLVLSRSNVETGLIEGAGSLSIADASCWYTRLLDTGDDDTFVDHLFDLPATPAYGIRLWTAQREYRIGETIRFHAEVDKDCYLTLIDQGTSGGVTILFPNGYHPNNFVHAGEGVAIPAASYGFEIVVQPPAGHERVVAIATERPWLPIGQAGGQAPFLTVGDGKGVGYRDLRLKAKGLSQGQWSAAVWEFRVKEREAVERE